MIPLFRPTKPDMTNVNRLYSEALASGQLTNFAKYHEKCSSVLAERHGGYWLPVSNGSFAIELSLMLLQKDVRRIAVPNFTFASTIQSIVRAGKIPVIFETTKNLEMDLKLLRKHRQAYDAVLAVVPFGKTYDPAPLRNLCADLWKVLLWDRAGGFPNHDGSNINTYSLHASKSIPVGEGGLIRFPNFQQYWQAKRLACFGFDSNKNSTDSRATNMKLDELRSCVLYDFLTNSNMKIRERTTRMRRLLELYVDGIDKKHFHTLNTSAGQDMSLIVLNLKNAKALSEHLNRNGIASRLYYSPLLNDQEAFKRFRFYGSNKRELRNWIALPSDATSAEAEFVIKKIGDFYKVRS